MNKNEIFIEKCIKVYGDVWNFSLLNYIKAIKKVRLICNRGHIIETTPKNHLNGFGCSKCREIETLIKLKNDFIEKSKKIHNNWNYSMVDYLNNHTKVKLMCESGHTFEQTPMSNLHGNGCPTCSNKIKKDTNYFIEHCEKLFNYKYKYPNTNYVNNKEYVEVECSKHGTFKIRASNHMSGRGCKLCNESNGERNIIKILKELNITFERQKKFDGCMLEKHLNFDFYLPEFNCCIEYDGEQHYKSVEYFGGNVMFKKIIKRDKTKNDYCLKNNINLLRIKYDENIENVLNIFLKKKKSEKNL